MCILSYLMHVLTFNVLKSGNIVLCYRTHRDTHTLTLTHSVCRWGETLIFCMSRDGYAMVSPQQVRHSHRGVL